MQMCNVWVERFVPVLGGLCASRVRGFCSALALYTSCFLGLAGQGSNGNAKDRHAGNIRGL